MRLIPEAEINLDFARSSGPGGQNVNKTSTKAQLRWHLDSSAAFSPEEKALIAERLAHRLTSEGYLAIDVSEERSQLQNKQRAIEILTELVNEALVPAIPRRATRPPRSSKLARLQSKKQRGQIKQLRKPLTNDPV
jgi:ribosome-associated protein